MIVDPDFLDHWRTRMLVDMLDDECAPLYVIRLWGHCHNRREWIFNDLPKQGTKAICRYSGDADTLEQALIDCGFLERDGSQITMVGWDEHNASLITSWANGSKGGRPKKATRKEPSENPWVNPDETQAKPETNPSGTDKIGLDKIGLDYIDNTPSPPSSAPKKPAKRKSKIPVNFELTTELSDSALKYWHGKGRQDLNPKEEFEKFHTHHTAHGSTMLDWGAAWRTWFMNAVKFNRPGDVNGKHQSTNRPLSEVDRIKAVNARRAEEREKALQGGWQTADHGGDVLGEDDWPVHPSVDTQVRR